MYINTQNQNTPYDSYGKRYRDEEEEEQQNANDRSSSHANCVGCTLLSQRVAIGTLDYGTGTLGRLCNTVWFDTQCQGELISFKESCVQGVGHVTSCNKVTVSYL